MASWPSTSEPTTSTATCCTAPPRSRLDRRRTPVWAAMGKERDAGRTWLLGVSNVSLGHLEQMQGTGAETPAFVQNRCFARRGWDRGLVVLRGATHRLPGVLAAHGEPVDPAPSAGPAASLPASTPRRPRWCSASHTRLECCSLTGTSDPEHMVQVLRATPRCPPTKSGRSSRSRADRRRAGALIQFDGHEPSRAERLEALTMSTFDEIGARQSRVCRGPLPAVSARPRCSRTSAGRSSSRATSSARKSRPSDGSEGTKARRWPTLRRRTGKPGYLVADVDPLALRTPVTDLDLDEFGFRESDLDREMDCRASTP